MGFRAFNHGVNVVAFEKNNQQYAMTCAWAMQVDYDKVVLLIGSQSVTGRNISPGDVIGISALNIEQKNIALQLGDEHSDEKNKLEGIEIEKDETAIYVVNACRMMKVKVREVIHLKDIECDNLIYGDIISKKEENLSFLNMENM